MRASTQYTNTQKRGSKPVTDDHTPVDQVPQQELVLRHADLVKRIAYHLVSRMPPNVEVDDLIQSGMMGLLDAAKHYSATKGANFETYAGIRIRGAMLDEVRKSDWTPRSVHRNMREMADVVRKIENEKGQDATPTDIAERLGVSIEEYHKLVQDAASCRLFSFDQMGSSEDESSPADHAGLNQVIDFHVRRHAADQVIGNALHQISVPQHQFLLWHLIDRNVRI
ncbi:MAG TPA: sigma-70 family RNA polymerase sigma factor, partial [Steroidobacteraceae bacterium]|nr:sigma-70 family RNA polymerase sigma factor [Steroidobacteraceae bacterium]